MSDNNAGYNNSGQDNYYASNDSTQADFGQFQDGCNQPAAQPYNPNQYASRQPVQGHAPDAQGNNIPDGTYGNAQPYGQPAAYGSSVPADGLAAPAYAQPTQPAQPSYGQPMYGPADYAQSAQTPMISSRRSPNTRSPHTISRQSTRSRPTIRRPNSSQATATRRSRRSSPAFSACSSAP